MKTVKFEIEFLNKNEKDVTRSVMVEVAGKYLVTTPVERVCEEITTKAENALIEQIGRDEFNSSWRAIWSYLPDLDKVGDSVEKVGIALTNYLIHRGREI